MLRYKARYALLIFLAAGACSTEQGDGAGTDGDDSGPAPPAAEASTGRIIEVKMITDAGGNYYEPAAIHAESGDVLRFTIVSGVHNVNFLPDSNPGKQGLPPASDLLQLPGQTFDVPVTFAEGSYYFQCDPHALLGMTGRLHVAGDEHDDDND